MAEATVNTEEWALRLNKELTEARTRIAALEAQLAERVKAAYLKGRSEWAPAGVLSDNERTERDWQSALSALEATPPAPKVTEENWLTVKQGGVQDMLAALAAAQEGGE